MTIGSWQNFSIKIETVMDTFCISSSQENLCDSILSKIIDNKIVFQNLTILFSILTRMSPFKVLALLNSLTYL